MRQFITSDFRPIVTAIVPTNPAIVVIKRNVTSGDNE